MSDVKPWEVEYHGDFKMVVDPNRIVDGEPAWVYLETPPPSCLIHEDYRRTLLYAPVYESIVRELADAKRFGPHHDSISLPELAIRLHLRAREALREEE